MLLFVYITIMSSDADLIFVIFSPHRKFLDKFFSTQKCVNYDKTDFATKFVFDKTDFFQENSINFAYMATFSTSHIFQMWRISDFCKEFEQFMEFYRNLYSFCSKFVWKTTRVDKICVEKK